MKNTKMNGKSLNTQEELLELLKQKFPEVFAEGFVDCQKLKQTLGEDVDLDNERYGMTWAGKNNCFRVIQEPTTATLKPVREESVDFDETENLFIEGDNLEVLKILQKPYYGKVKMIYIDVPYNTGNDFIYNDDFKQDKAEYEEKAGIKDGNGDLRGDGLMKNTKDRGHYHSDWLNMMYPRLFLARNLLRQDGVIFVSIDDNEVHNLRVIMNEVFGEENFIGELIWKKKGTSTNVKGAHLSPLTEYIVVYGRSDGAKLTPRIRKKETRNYPFKDDEGNYRTTIIEKKSTGDYDRASMKFEILGKTPRKGKRWQIGEVKARELEKKGRFIEENGIIKLKIYDFEDIDTESAQPNLLLEHGSTQVGQKEVDDILGGTYFDTPKPTALIKHLLNLGCGRDEIVLDFFAGSGTTAHAVIAFNAENDESCKCISVQLPELCDEKSEAYKAGYKTIADIAKERIRRAGKKIKDERGKQLDLNGNKLDTGFKVFKLDQSNFKIWRTDVKDEKSLLEQMSIFVDNVKEESTQDNILYELILKSGLGLNVDVVKKEADKKTYFLVDEVKLIICLEDKISQVLVDAILAEKPEKVICLDKAFGGNDQLKTNTLLQMESAKIDFKVI